MRRTIIACTLVILGVLSTSVLAQENPSRTRYVYVVNSDDESSSSWPSWKMPNLVPTSLGSRLASGTRSTWNTLKSGTSRAWYATQYTVAPWSKPKPSSLTGSRGISSSKPKTKSKSNSSEETASWWPKLDFWNTEPEKKMKTVADWQDQSSPAAGFDE